MKNKSFVIRKESTGFMIMNLSGSQVYGNIVRIAAGLITAKLLLPEILGIFNGFGLILGYLPIMQIGVMNALNRELPYYLGKGDVNRSTEYAATAQWWEIILSTVSFIVLIVLSIYYFVEQNFLFGTGFLTYAILSVHHFYGLNYLQILYRTNKDFNNLSRNTYIVSTVSLLGVIFVWKWGFYGLCLRSIINNIVEFGLLWKRRPLKVSPRYSKNNLINLIKVGFPIFLVGIIFSLWGTFQDTLILKLGGAEKLGLYSLAAMLIGSLSIISNAINQVIYPKLSFMYGSGKKIKELINVPVKPMFVSLLILLPTILVVYFLLPYIVNSFLPNYSSGINVAQWSLPLILVSVLGVYNLFFNVLKKQKDYLISIVAGFVVFSIIVYFNYKLFGFDLIIFPIAMFIGKLIQIIVAFFYISNYAKNGL